MDNELLRFNKTSKFLFFDFETWNLCLSFSNNRMWQYSSLMLVEDNIVDEHDFYVKWPEGIRISEDAARITKFDKIAYNKRAVPQEQVFLQFKKDMEEADFICGHNILGFDVYLAQEWFKLHGIKPPNIVAKMIDTAPLAKGLKNNTPYDPKACSLAEYMYKMYHLKIKGLKYSLELLGKEYKIDHDYTTLHDGLSDIKLNVKVWNKLKWQLEI